MDGHNRRLSRGFGGPQGLMVAESWMEKIGEKLGLPTEEVTARNFPSYRVSVNYLGEEEESLSGRSAHSLQPEAGQLHYWKVTTTCFILVLCHL